MRKIFDDKNLRIIAILVIGLVLAMAICVANLIMHNVFTIIMSIMLVMAICFALGYTYCRYEGAKEGEKAEPTSESVAPTDINTNIDIDEGI